MSYTVTATFATQEEAIAFLSGPSRTTAAPEVAKAAETTAKPAKATKAKAAEPEVAKAEPVKAEVEEAAPAKLDFAAIRGIIEKNTAVNGLDDSKRILADLGFVKASAIPEAKYAEVYAKFEAAIDGDE